MEKPTVKEETFLQCILGVDKRNPSITLYRDLSADKLHVYCGHELFEVVRDDREQVASEARIHYADAITRRLLVAARVH